jgi:prepilin-type N-terminal cleavage/methylation domain-containing protein
MNGLVRVPAWNRLVATWIAAAARSKDLRNENGFGMIELMCAMVVLAVGVLAVFGMFQSSLVQIRRAANISTAAALADTEIERYRAVKYTVIGLDDGQVGAADATYKSDTAYNPETAPATALASSVTASDTTLTVTSATGFPTAAPYYVKIGSEVLLVESGAGTTTWTVKRGQQNTSAAAQAGGAAVVQKQRVHLNACGTSPCTSKTPTQTVTGPDGKSYRLDTYITWDTPVNTGGTTGRNTKLVTLVVRDPAVPSKVYARVSSSFDESTGL